MNFAQALQLIKSHPAVDTPDVQALFNPKSVHHYDEKTHARALQLVGDSETLALMLALPQKQLKRFTQTVNGVLQGSPDKVDATYLRSIIALYVSPDHTQTYSAVHALVTRMTREGAAGAANTRGIGHSNIDALFKRSHGMSTALTKVSGALGARGIFQTMGATFRCPGKHDEAVTLNESHPMVRALVGLVQKSTTGQLETIK